MFGGVIIPQFGLTSKPFILGSHNPNEICNRKFDLVNNKWTVLPSAPIRSFTGCSAVSFKQKILLSALEFLNKARIGSLWSIWQLFRSNPIFVLLVQFEKKET
ncbi:unnamed protein product [Blepharisma stoltei]|uniref:Uncharacterized protein n=1 Tax=Blepharisma stoltei TaxID=1481888 RepID=A0AAU9IBB8_9CILI|nr:unnamed protein product [Blepharisma stoltei]